MPDESLYINKIDCHNSFNEVYEDSANTFQDERKRTGKLASQINAADLMLHILCIFRSNIASILHIREVQRQKKTLLIKKFYTRWKTKGKLKQDVCVQNS